MTLYHAFDASVPPSKPFPGSEIACGYIGGDTPHVWTVEEWNAASDNGRLHVLPIFVRSDPTGHDPKTDAEEAVAKAESLGWAKYLRRAIVLDSETSQDVGYIKAFAREIGHGFECVDYRSISALISHPSGLMEWAADYSLPPMPSSANQHGFQYAAGLDFDNTKVDVSIFDEIVFAHCGRGPRK